MTSIAATPPPSAVAAADSEDRKLRESAAQFEAMFLQTLLKEMREAQLENGFFGNSAGSSVYEGMFESHLSKDLARDSPLGIADALMRQWGKRPDAHQAAADIDRRVQSLQAQRSYALAGEAAGPRAATPDRNLPKPQPNLATPRDASSDYGWRKDPIDGSRRFHHGVDLAAPAGTPVLNVAPGRVVSAGEQGGYGKQVVVEHADGWRSRYAHLEAIEVEPGSWLDRGTTLGKVGSTGRSTGPHLHFETTRHGESVDPELAAPGSIRAQVLGSPADKSGEGNSPWGKKP